MRSTLTREIAADNKQREKVQADLQTLNSRQSYLYINDVTGAEGTLLSFDFESGVSGGPACYFSIRSGRSVSWSAVDKCAVRCWLEAASQNPKLSYVTIVITTTLGDDDAEMVAGAIAAVKETESKLHIKQRDFILLSNAAPSVMQNWSTGLQTINLTASEDESFPYFFACLGKCELSSLQVLSVTNDGHIESMEGIGMYLARKAPPSLETLELNLLSVAGSAMEKLTSGLLQNTSIDEFSFRVERTDNNGSDCLAECLSATSKLETVYLSVAQEHGAYFQNVVLAALSTNTSIRQLVLHSGFYDLSCDNQVEMMLATNTTLQDLSIQIFLHDTLFSNAWFQPTANGLRGNSTLQELHFEIYLRGRASLNVGPLFDALTSVENNLRILNIDSHPMMGSDDALRFAAMVQNPNCTLRDVRITCSRDKDLVPIFEACQQNRTLRSLEMFYNEGRVDQRAWESIALTIPHLNLLYLQAVNMEPEPGDDPIHQVLLNAVAANQCIETAQLELTEESREEFATKLQDICHIHRVRKVVAALTSSLTVSTSVPQFLACRNKFLLQALLGESEERVAFRRDTLFAFLRNHPFDTKMWKHVGVLLTASVLGKRKRQSEN